jgi:hypothetical protein
MDSHRLSSNRLVPRDWTSGVHSPAPFLQTEENPPPTRTAGMRATAQPDASFFQRVAPIFQDSEDGTRQYPLVAFRSRRVSTKRVR